MYNPDDAFYDGSDHYDHESMKDDSIDELVEEWTQEQQSAWDDYLSDAVSNYRAGLEKAREKALKEEAKEAADREAEFKAIGERLEAKSEFKAGEDYVFLVWDWKQQIDVEELNAALQKIPGAVVTQVIPPPGTFEDEYVLVVHSPTVQKIPTEWSALYLEYFEEEEEAYANDCY